MVRQISLLLGIGALLTICANPVQAEPVQRSSRGSLNTLESRSTEKDAAEFFPGIQQGNAPSYGEGSVGSESRQDAKFNVLGWVIVTGVPGVVIRSPALITYPELSVKSNPVVESLCAPIGQ